MVKSEKDRTGNFSSDEEHDGGRPLVFSLLFKAIFFPSHPGCCIAAKLFFDGNC